MTYIVAIELDSGKSYCKSCHHNKYVAFELDGIRIRWQKSRGVPESARSISQAQLAAALECTLQLMRCFNVKKAVVESTSICCTLSKAFESAGALEKKVYSSPCVIIWNPGKGDKQNSFPVSKDLEPRKNEIKCPALGICISWLLQLSVYFLCDESWKWFAKCWLAPAPKNAVFWKVALKLQTKNPMPISPIKTKSQNNAEGNCLWGFSEHLGLFLGY